MRHSRLAPACLRCVAVLAAAACGGADPRAARPTTAGAAMAAPDDTAAFRPLAVGDPAPAYAAVCLAPASAFSDTIRVGTPGQPPALVNVWATRCASCREEMGDLEALHREFGPRGLRVVGVSVDEAPDARVRRFVKRERLTFAVAHDPDGRVRDAFRLVGVPETYLVDGEGRVRWTRAGNVHGALGEARAAIGRALGAAR